MIRYIVFLLVPEFQSYTSDGRRIDKHDGEIFSSLIDAKEYAVNAIKDKLCTRFVIGSFVIENQTERIGIYCIETYGFRNDKKNLDQLELFR